MKPILVLGYPLSESQLASLGAIKDLDLTSLVESKEKIKSSGEINTTSLTRRQGAIVRALNSKPLTEQMLGTLEILWQEFHGEKRALAIEVTAERLMKRLDIDSHESAVNYVKGAIRAFGKRLDKTLGPDMATKHGLDKYGEHVSDVKPVLALLDIFQGPNGEACHRLTTDGATAVGVALGFSSKGVPVSMVDPEEAGDPNEVVTQAMSRLAAALIHRVAKSMNCSIDEAIKEMAALAGAG